MILNDASVWSFSFFTYYFYLVLLTSSILYFLPVLTNYGNNMSSSTVKNPHNLISGSELFSLQAFVTLLLLITLTSWSSSATVYWVGHLIVDNFQIRMIYLVTLSYTLLTLLSSSVSYFSSRDSYDYLIVQFNFIFWISLIYQSNSLFSAIFIIEVLSALIFLLIITSNISSFYTYSNLKTLNGHIMQNLTPYSYLHSLIYFYWVSLITSLNLFVFLLLSYAYFKTFELYISQSIFFQMTMTTSIKNLISTLSKWFFLVFFIFIKCGIAPLYFWKPIFFKGLTLHFVVFYTSFFYTFFFWFILNFLSNSLSTVFYFYSIIFVTFNLTGLLVLLTILLESTYLKSFFAVSSILNSLLVLMALITTNTTSVAIQL